MRRRSALHLLAGTALLAGCLGTDDPGTDAGTTPTPDDEPTPTPDDGPFELGDEVAVDGLGTVAVESVAVQRSLVHHHLWRDLYEPDDAQMLLLEGTVEDDADPDFEARLDGDPVDSAERVPLGSDGPIYALSVPVRSVDEAAVVLGAGDRPAWTLPDDALELLAAAPEFHLHDATIREAGDETVLDLAVENRGNRDGTFRAVVDHASAADADGPVRFPVPAGETVEETVRHSILDSWPADAEFDREIGPGARRFGVSG